MGMIDGPAEGSPHRAQATLLATILGGRWDGHEVEYCGACVTYKGDDYVALRADNGRRFYILNAMVPAWFRVR